MADELAEILQNFDLSSRELQGADLVSDDLAAGVKECKTSLIGRIMGEKVANYTGVKNFVTVAWSYPKELRAVELGPNLFQFILPIESDKEKILQGGHNQILVLNKWFDGIEDNEAAFYFAPLWVQAWNLPVHWMSKEAGRKIGPVFQQVRDVIIPQNGGKEGRHLKLLVMVDISQPLLRGTVVKVDGTIKWANFKYERCPDFCYNCGVIGHSERTCVKRSTAGAGGKNNQYGTWMKTGFGKNSPQKRQFATIYNPNKHHWKMQEGEWIVEERSVKETKQTDQSLDGPSNDKQTEKNMRLLTKRRKSRMIR